MSDDIYAGEEVLAHQDQADATALRTDASSMRDEAQHDYAAADRLQAMGGPDQGALLRVEGDNLQAQATDFEHRADQLDHSAGLDLTAHDLLKERDNVQAGASAAESRAEGAQFVLDYADTGEGDRTRWTAEVGAATGEAAALHKRADELTEQAVGDIHAAAAEHDTAHEGIDGRHWTGVGQPPGEVAPE